MGRCLNEKLEIRSPPLRSQKWVSFGCLSQRLLEYDHTIGPEAGEGVGDGCLSDRASEKKAGRTPDEPDRKGNLSLLRDRLAAYEVGSSLDPLDHVHEVGRILCEVSLEGDHHVPLGVLAPIHCLTEEHFHRSSISKMSFAPEDPERKPPSIALESGLGPIGRRIVENDDLVVSAEIGHDSADLPDEESNRPFFIVDGDGDEDH
jgi:hypothetical protein